MNFNYAGYDLKFIQKRICNDKSDHLFTLKYKFYSAKTKYVYVIHADYHRQDVFAIKFYCKKDKRSEFKYSKIVNKGDWGNILITCAQLVPLLLNDFPNASFGFAASRSVDTKNKSIEPHRRNQRFRMYRYIVALKFGNTIFTHFEYPEISCYLLVNNTCKNIHEKEQQIVAMFTSTYETLVDI